MDLLLIIFGIISFTTLILYGADKSKAKRGAWRIPERVLLGFSFFGGALGGVLGMMLFRHKTKHWYFVLINALGFFWQASLVVFLFIKSIDFVTCM